MIIAAVVVAATGFIQLTGPDQQVIQINPQTIIDYRTVRGMDIDYWAAGTRCVIHTVDGKFIPVHETCDQIHQILGDSRQ